MDAHRANHAAISFDGVRYQVIDRSEEATTARTQQRQSGPHRKGEHWKESRVACVMSMTGGTHEVDSMPELRMFLAGGAELQRKLTEIGQRYRRWAEMIWCGEVGLVIEQLAGHPTQLDEALQDIACDAPREAIGRSLVCHV